MKNVSVVILAAGQGKRMKSPLPKVLHTMGGMPLIFHTLDRVAEAIPGAEVCIVVGHGRAEVEAAIKAQPRFSRGGTPGAATSDLKIQFVEQTEQKGTGHAARVAMDSAWGNAQVKAKRPILILPGDLPLISSELIRESALPLPAKCAVRLLTTELADPTGYGRVIRRGKAGPVLKIVEERDATVRERAVREVAVSIYLFQSPFLQTALQRLSNKNAQSEYYLTDLVAIGARNGSSVDRLLWADATELRGVNDLWELATARRMLNERLVRKWAVAGVSFDDPCSTQIEAGVTLAQGTSIGAAVVLRGDTHVGSGARIDAHSVVTSSKIGSGAEIKVGCVIENSEVSEGAKVGPYAHLRPSSFVGPRAKIGNFVELKKSRVGAETSIAHLSYLGDAVVGDRVNIGCGFVTCNFDGREIEGSRKHKTIIEDDVFMGSDCQTIAPITIGKGAYVASGSTLTQNVESGALAIARSRQVNKPGYAARLSKASKSR